jgi:hypothetical protein
MPAVKDVDHGHQLRRFRVAPDFLCHLQRSILPMHLEGRKIMLENFSKNSMLCKFKTFKEKKSKKSVKISIHSLLWVVKLHLKKCI